MIYYGCPKCQAPMASPDSMIGQAETCTECGNVATVPNSPHPSAPAAVAVLPPTPTPVAAPPSAPAAGLSRGPNDRTVLSARPAMFRNRPVAFILLVILFPLGIIVLPIWWLVCLCTRLTVTESRTILRTGILSKATNEVRHHDVRNIQVNQGIFQRLFGVGDIGISSAGQAGIEITVSGMPAPQAIAKAIRDRQG